MRVNNGIRCPPTNTMWHAKIFKMGEVTVEYFKTQFQEESQNQNFNMPNHIPTLITGEKNDMITKMLDIEEVNQVVFELNGDGVAGPDGVSVDSFKNVEIL